ncbi:glycerate kinase [Pseudolysinimonas kribbensis]|uniref:glycerate kinase n=1 Tax=Pseudolysinimonas kribbensis TaxID=433641 RepID=UPI0031CE8968
MGRIVIAPDSFKGSLDAAPVADAIAAGWRSVRPDDELVLLPQADGGEGTLDAVASAVPLARVRDAGPVTGPDGRPVEGHWLLLPDGTAVIELAQPSGLPLMAALDPLGATTRGLGEVIGRALDEAPARLVIGLGGSASTDGGAGALAALGLGLLDEAGVAIPDGGGALAQLARIDRSGLRPAPPGGVRLLSDVTAPLFGPRGAAAVFGPQKGAGPDDVAALDAALARFAGLLGGDPERAGAGAAGGTGYGFAAAWGAVLEPGSSAIAELTGLTAAAAGADVLLTGEGRFDATSRTGKAVGNALELVAGTTARAGVISGRVDADPGCWSVALVDLAGSPDEALRDPARWLAEAGAAAARALG